MIVLRALTDAAADESQVCAALEVIADNGNCQRAVLDGKPLRSPTPDETEQWSIPAEEFRGLEMPSVSAIGHSRWLVAFPEPTRTDDQTFAVATVSDSSRDTVRRMVDAAWRNQQLLRQAADQQVLLDEYSDQVLHDFAEIHWMEKLISQLKVCSLSRSLRQTAAGLLEPLRDIIRARVLAFISADAWPKPCDTESCGDEFPGVWISRDETLQPVTFSLLQRYRTEAERGIVVRNRSVVWPEADEFPEVTGLVLVTVQKNGHGVGWIMALDRMASRSQRNLSCPGANSMRTEEEFSTSEAGLLAAAASILATHDDNVRLLQGNIDLSLGIIRALTNAVDAKDQYTRGHSDRVARMAWYLGSLMQLSGKECQQLLMAGLLHDVGKIGIPDSVLKNPGQLSHEEFAMIRNHPVFGFNILQPVEELAFVLPGVLHHHEAWNGGGYPDGLAGHAIPRIARILAIVDTYDAMTSDRPYREGMNFEQAEQKIRDGAGKFWDPELVDLFLQHCAEFRQICEDARPGHDSFSMVDTKAIVMSPDTAPSRRQHAGVSDWPEFRATALRSGGIEPIESAGSSAAGMLT